MSTPAAFAAPAAAKRVARRPRDPKLAFGARTGSSSVGVSTSADAPASAPLGAAADFDLDLDVDFGTDNALVMPGARPGAGASADTMVGSSAGARPSSAVALSVAYTYKPNLARAPAESAAFLTIFVSRDVRSTPYARVPLEGDKNLYEGVSTLWLRRDALAALPRDTTLSVCAFAHTTNRHGEPALNQAGSARFYLDELLASPSSVGSAKAGAGAAALPRPHASRTMAVTAADNYPKGTIEVSAHIADAGDARRALFAPLAEYDYDERVASHRSRFAAAVDAQAALGREVFARIAPERGYETMSAIHIPFYAAYGIRMPGAYFALVRPDAPTDAAFFENALDIVLRRHYPRLSVAEARARIAGSGQTGSASGSDGGATDYEVAVVLAKLLCIFTNYCTYLTDKVVEGHRTSGVGAGIFAPLIERSRDREIESFDVTPRLTKSCDCEDDGCESAMQALDLAAYDASALSPALARVCSVRRSMECEMTLKGVLGGALSDAMSGGRTPRFGGHMNARLRSRLSFAEMLARVHESGASPYEGMEMGPLSAERQRTLPVLDLEGTGVLEPDCGVDTTGPLHAYLSAGSPEAALHRAKYSVQTPRDDEHLFYKATSGSLLPDRAVDGYGALEVSYTRHRGGRAISSSVPFPASRCVTQPDVALWAMPELSDELLRWAPHVLKHLHPVPAHTLPAAGRRAADARIAGSGTHYHAKLERIVVAREARAADHPAWLSHDYFLRDSQLSDERVAALQTLIRAHAAVRKVEYHCEPVTADLTGWLLRFWLDPALVR